VEYFLLEILLKDLKMVEKLLKLSLDGEIDLDYMVILIPKDRIRRIKN